MYLQNYLAHKALRSYIEIKVSQQEAENGRTHGGLPQTHQEGLQEEEFLSHGDAGEEEEG